MTSVYTLQYWELGKGVNISRNFRYWEKKDSALKVINKDPENTALLEGNKLHIALCAV